ncbi:hypothetical protein ACGF3K_14385 [Streptomyces sp. NPDC047980]|uniref:hypothetical protein n=1 Tax=Streptomyces sp. NPDC047980 TaxID=3365494 RepID=UPI0037180592
MSPLERLIKDAAPNCPEIPKEQRTSTNRPWTRAEQDAHWNDLAEAIGAYRDMRPVRRTRTAA